MKYIVRFSDAAEDDVAEIIAYLNPLAGERVARRYIDDLIDYCYSFELFPERGTRWPGREGYRVVGYRKKASIVISIVGDTVTIVRIFNRGRNVDLQDTEIKD